jgi:hypothetical protein
MTIIATHETLPDRVILSNLADIDAERMADVFNLIKPEGKEYQYRVVDDLVYDWVITD